jgi:hypothetical protein
VNWALVIGTLAIVGVLATLRAFGHAHVRLIPVHLFGDNRFALWLYAMFMLPGTVIHELAHAGAATLLGVDVQGISMSPSVQRNWITLGYVRHGPTDVARHALIGVAPLLAGTLVIALIGLLAFDLGAVYDEMTSGNWPEGLRLLFGAFTSWEAWLAAYLVFVTSINMFPSPTDRQGFLPVGLFLLVLLGLALLIGLGPSLLHWLARPVNLVFQWLFLVFGVTLVLDILFTVLLAAGHEAVARQFPSI